jgi:ferritin-like metal-binding protein YciE
MREELKDAYAKKLSKALSMEEIIIRHLPVMIDAATDDKLRAGLATHLEETRAQRSRLLEILSVHDVGAEDDRPFAMMVESAGGEIEAAANPAVRDALIIAAAQTVEHYEMARYGTLLAWARELDDAAAVSPLRETLSEEQAADKKLSAIAEGGIFATGVNEVAAGNV